MKAKVDWHYSRAQLAGHYLDAFDLGLIAAKALYARRRMGKTEFLRKDLEPVAAQRGYAVGYANLWSQAATPEGAVVSAVFGMGRARGLVAKARKRLAEPSISKVKLGGKLAGVGEATAEAQFKDVKGDDALGVLQAGFRDFDKSKNTGLLLLDEAQVLAQPFHENLALALRAELDTRKDHLKVVFTGSSENTLRRMFGDEKRPFYNWAQMEPFPLLGRDFVEDLTARTNKLTTYPLKIKDALRAFDTLKQTPEFFRRFLDRYLTHPFEGVDQAIDESQRLIYGEQGFDKKWEQMLPADRVVLQLVARGQQDMHGKLALKTIGLVLGLSKPAEISVPQNALKRLMDNQILIRVGHGEYRFEDEAFADWIKKEKPLEH